MKMLLKSKNVFMTRVEDRDCILKSGMEEGVVETHDRLAELLEKYEAKGKQHEKHFNKKEGDNVWKTQRKNYYNLSIAG